MSKLISYPNEVAWQFLKQSKEDEPYDLTRVMDPADVKAASKYTASLSPEKKKQFEYVSKIIQQMPPDKKEQIMGSAHRLLEEHRGKLSERLSQVPQGEPQDTGEMMKLFPLIIGVVFAVDALNQSQGAKGSIVGNVIADIGNTATGGKAPFGKSDWDSVKEWDDTAAYINPFTGNPIPGTDVIEDPSLWQKVTRGAVSAGASLINPFAVVGGAGRVGARATGRATGRAMQGAGKATTTAGKGVSRLAEPGNKAARAARVADDTAQVPLSNFKATRNIDYTMDTPRIQQSRALNAQASSRAAEDAVHGVAVTGPAKLGEALQQGGKNLQGKGVSRIDDIAARYSKFADKTGGAGKYGKANRLAGASAGKLGTAANLAYRGWQGNQRTPDPLSVQDIGNYFGLGGPTTDMPNTSGMDAFGGNAQSQFAGAGAAAGGQSGGFGQGYGMGDVSNVNSNMGARREIWNPYADYSTTRGQTLAGRGVGDPGSFGGFGKGFGNMKIGERMLRDAEEMMYKASCTTCGKKDCLGKMNCSMNKAECPKCGKNCKCDTKKAECPKCGKNCKCDTKKADDKKKPAHGMVIVIGSKAGPGPSTDGKRDKKDSEDKKE